MDGDEREYQNINMKKLCNAIKWMMLNGEILCGIIFTKRVEKYFEGFSRGWLSIQTEIRGEKT